MKNIKINAAFAAILAAGFLAGAQAQSAGSAAFVPPNFAAKDGAPPQELVAHRISPEQRAAATGQATAAVTPASKEPVVTAPAPQSKPVKQASKKSEQPRSAITEVAVPVKKVNAEIEAFQQWADGSRFKPTMVSGVMRFQYGEMEPRVICAELRVCLVELNDDEVVEFVTAGDDVNWDIPKPLQQGGHQVQSIKPKAAGLETNLNIGTDKRTYAIRLISTKDQYISRYGFSYGSSSAISYAGQFKRPSEEAEKAKAATDLAAAEAAAGPKKSEYQKDFESTVPAASVPVIEYALKGDNSIKPERVFSDGKKTFIQMPADISSRELPTLFLLDNRGSMGMASPRYNTEKRMFSVDFVIEKAMLMLGSGRDAQKVEIAQIAVKKN